MIVPRTSANPVSSLYIALGLRIDYKSEETNLDQRAPLKSVDTGGWSLPERLSKMEHPRPCGYAIENASGL